MSLNRRLFFKNYVVFFAFLILLLIAVLGWFDSARLQAFHRYHKDIARESVKGVEKQVAFYIMEKRRLVELFVNDHIEQIRQLVNNSDDDSIHDHFGHILSKHFPDRFAFSVADINGAPKFEDFDGLVSELCLTDIKKFAGTNQEYHPYIHPNSEGYHFDIMVRYGKDGNEGIFFVSFLAKVLGNIIESIQSPEHEIVLILPRQNDLIEVVAGGARNKWIRNDYRLSELEHHRIITRHKIEGTEWEVVDIHNQGIYSDYRNKLLIESIIIFLVFTSIAVFFAVRLRREERQREIAEGEKQALMSTVSHEFRSPVSIIKSALDLIGDGDAGKINAEIRKYIDIALSSTRQLMFLVNDFLDIQKMQSGSLTYDKQEVQLSSVVVEAVHCNELYANQFSVQYKLNEPLAVDRVFCDINRIEQVLTNLLTNAAKYGAENDVITITVDKLDDRLRVSIADHGPGIPKQFQSSVFEKFAMTKVKTKNQKVQSSGLGLSIAKAIIEQHGGKIGFETQIDPDSVTGTTFWFELPIARSSK